MTHSTITTALLALTALAGCSASPSRAPSIASDAASAPSPATLRAVMRNRGDANLSARSFAASEARMWLSEVSTRTFVFAAAPTSFDGCDRSVTVSIDGEPPFGASYLLGDGASLTYIEDCVSGTRAWRADEGALTVDGLGHNRWSFSIESAHMAPSNHFAVGTFDLSVSAHRVLGWSTASRSVRADML